MTQLLLTEQLAEFGDHPRAPHRTTARVSELSNVDCPGHVRVAMTEQERDLVHAFAGEQRSTRDGVPQAVHRWQLAMRHGHRLATLILSMKDREGRTAVVVHGAALCDSQRPPDVPLAKWPTGPSGEHEDAGLDVLASGTTKTDRVQTSGDFAYLGTQPQ